MKFNEALRKNGRSMGLSSALHPTTDIDRDGRQVRFVPGTDIADAFEIARQALEFRVDERENAEKFDDFSH
jgi:hypothetical protein